MMIIRVVVVDLDDDNDDDDDDDGCGNGMFCLPSETIATTAPSRSHNHPALRALLAASGTVKLALSTEVKTQI